MPNTFITADSHFGHNGVCRFARDDGSKLRPWDNIEEMDAELVRRWNAVVGPNDTVIHLGDVVMNRRHLGTIARCNGKKTLVMGNHDEFNVNEFLPYFENICGVKQFSGFVLTHVPVHTSSLSRWRGNWHGHLHANQVMRVDQYKQEVIDSRYMCLSVEQTDFAPISFDDALKRFQERQAEFPIEE